LGHDRFIRNREYFGNAIAYIENNPVAAGLVNRAEEWPYSSAAENAGGTPAVPGMI
jgi:putative transposase